MAWYWIVLIVIGYFAIGSVLAGLLTRIPDCNSDDLLLFIVLFWPVVVPILLVILMCISIIDFFKV
jgi:Na+/proline symporter